MKARSTLRVSLAGVALAMLASTSHAADSSAVAINILVLPDAPMRDRASQLHERLARNHPQPFAFDESHVPHLSLLHRFVAAKDLQHIYSAVERSLSRHPLVGKELTATGLEHSPWGDAEIVSITVDKQPELSALQAELIEALRPFAMPPGDRNAFVTSPGSSEIDAPTVEYVKTFERKRTGENFKPHITVGLSDAPTASSLQSDSSPPTNFEIEAIAVYQLGNIGTARKELWRSR